MIGIIIFVVRVVFSIVGSAVIGLMCLILSAVFGKLDFMDLCPLMIDRIWKHDIDNYIDKS